jgi:YD repeat-containing protein
MKTKYLSVVVGALLLLTASLANAADVCGNGLDDDGDAYADEGCGFANSVMGVCESPMSCAETGDIDPVTGAWVYQLPADIAPTVPFGPRFEFRRTYMSMYAPPAINYRTAMGNRWQHNFQSWLTVSGSAPNRVVIAHLPTGQDVRFAESGTPGDGYTYFNNFQAGAHFKHLRQATASPNNWELKTLTGEVYVFNWASPTGKLIEIRDTLATPNKITIAYLTSGQNKDQIDTVTDASGKKRFKFTYSSGLATSVAYQTGSGGTWTTRVTLAMSYTSSNPTTIQIGGTTIQTNTYTSGYLTNIADGGGKTLVNLNYVSATPGKLANVTTANGSLGYDYASSHAQCTGQTALFFNLANATACNVDGDCGTGFRCGGKTGSGSTGKCYRAARCLTTTTPTETLITTVTPFTPCTGACAPVAQYSWNTTTLDLKGIRLADNNWTSYQRDTNGMVLTIAEGDTDDDPTNASGAKTWLFYGNANFPGRVTEVRRQTDTPAGTTCSSTLTTHCKRTSFTWNADGLLSSRQELGFTGLNGATSFSYTTGYAYDTKGRLTQIDGPLTGSNDVVDYTYWTSADVFKDGYANLTKRKKNATDYLITTLDGYDYFGNAGSTQDPDGTFTCRTWDANRNYVSQHREAMAAQTSCTTTNAADLVTSYLRDTALRLTRTTNPLGDCEHREYDSFGRLSATKLRDDCNAASAGNTMSRSYSSNGQLLQSEYLDASGTVKKRETSTILDGLQVGSHVNPVSPSYARTFEYFADGALQRTSFENMLGKTEVVRDSQNRETTNKRFLTSLTSLDWVLNYPANNATSTKVHEKVTDPASKNVFTYLDDLGRKTAIVSPDSGTTVDTYDEASRLTSTVEARDTVEQVTHTFQFDNIGRKTVENYGTEECEDGNPVDVEYFYDSLAGATCPSGATCTRLEGRLARVKTFLRCNSSGTAAIFQDTYYGYDDAGRLIAEYISDTTGRTADLAYTWDKNGNSTAVKAPTHASMMSTFGGAGNSDANLSTSIARSVGGTPTNLITGVTWAPFGPVTQYDQENAIGGNKLRATLAWNLAYRATQIKFATTSVNKTTIDLAEDEKGRFTQKAYSNVDAGVLSDYFKYDWLDRVTCESTFAASECPTSGTVTSVAYNASNDRSSFRHSDPTFGNKIYTPTYVSGADKITSIAASETTNYSWSARGDRIDENDNVSSVDIRGFTYDGKRRVRTLLGYFYSGFTCNPFCSPTYKGYVITYAFDERDRLVFRSFRNAADNTESQTFYYYDFRNRLMESKFVPNAASPSTYSIHNFYWMGERPVAMWTLAFPAGTTARYFSHADESNRVLEVYTWPASGDATLAWALNPNTFGWDSVVTGSIYQPLRLSNMIVDDGTLAWSNADPFAPAALRPMLLVNRHSSYDPMSGTALQRFWEFPDEPYAPYSGEAPLRYVCAGGKCDSCPPPVGPTTAAGPGDFDLEIGPVTVESECYSGCERVCNRVGCLGFCVRSSSSTISVRGYRKCREGFAPLSGGSVCMLTQPVTCFFGKIILDTWPGRPIF